MSWAVVLTFMVAVFVNVSAIPRASAANGKSLGLLIVANPISGWKRLPTSKVLPVILKETKMESALFGEVVTGAVAAWQGPKHFDRLLVFVNNFSRGVPDPPVFEHSSLNSPCGATKKAESTVMYYSDSKIPGSEGVQCSAKIAASTDNPSIEISWVSGSTSVTIFGDGFTRVRFDAVSRKIVDYVILEKAKATATNS
jgi:hypothetical protein